LVKIEANDIIEANFIESKRCICDLVLVLCENNLNSMLQNTKILTEIVILSYKWIEKKENFTHTELEYFFDSFLPVINIYSENFLVDNTLAFMLSEGSEK
jgi:hypothetical protein